MAHFLFVGADRSGEEVRGGIDAPDRESALRQLRQQPITLLKLTETRRPAASQSLAFRLLKERGLGHKDLIFFARQLSTLLRAGTELDRALDILRQILTRKEAQSVVVSLIKEVRAGKGLAVALQRQNDAFPAYFISMVRAGEAAGALDASLMRLASLMERQSQIRSKMIGALIYPAILLFATIASVILIMTTVVPQFQPIFQQAGQDLPALTKFVIGMSDILVSGAPYLLLFLLVFVVGAVGLFKKPGIRLRIHATVLSVPLLGGIIGKILISRLSHVLAGLLQGGVPLIQAITISAEGIANIAVRQRIERARELVKNGVRLSHALKRQGGFPPLFLQLIDIGEESAKLGETLFEIARIYDDETEAAMQRTVALVTPIATILLGGMVALVLAAILLAVLKVNDLAI